MLSFYPLVLGRCLWSALSCTPQTSSAEAQEDLNLDLILLAQVMLLVMVPGYPDLT